ncbi:WD40 repeat domain-containing protein [Microvirga brassicacearum]|uniref:WD40 repeat domain-containing protein n=1 Tax=Microvirga brassicacearum TaxID=2580413 RepID=A0A5N3PGQ2_9HYPH|nr:WD40 repeat domain-containing protein [Microvirga brassicacearum]KAB0268903.1 WD40 repeat domain-containing protein [Microvirga brassicacearum]
MTAGPAPSLSQNVAALDAGAHVTAIGWLKGTLALGLGDGAVLLAKDGERHRIEGHPGAGVLTGISDGERFVTGGDDGRVAATLADGSTVTLAETKGAWIDSIAVSKGGAFAYGAGKRVIAHDEKGREKVLELASTARGIAFAPKGYRLAIAHYNGATLWFPNTEAKPELLEWKGSHLDITWAPDARFIVTSMQENALHGWRLVPDKGNMRMSGYPSKTRSLSWSSDGKWLATSGAEAAILWPFDSKEGPMGKQPRECGVRPAKVSRVAFHPNTFVLAVAYEDGCILLIRLTDAAELLVRPALKDSGVTALAWDQGGKRLAFGCEDGQAGILTLPT